MRRLLILFFNGILLAFGEEREVSQITPAQNVATLPAGFLLEEVFDVPQKFGSWVALTARESDSERCRLVAADQYGGVYDVVVAGENVTVTPLEIPLQGIHGLLWFQDSLYVVVGESIDDGKRGVYRAQDKDGDGSFESVEALRHMKTGGEHGIHSLVPSPDGEWIYLISGNYTRHPDLEKSQVPKVWDEDHLLPRNPDGRGHASDKMAPGGVVYRFRPDGTDWEFVSIGYRNPFDGAFNEHGELFVYDADMEWDMGMPWYRPTRLCWAKPGSEYGWRNGTGKWPSYYEDSLPPVVEFGPGSPAGVVSGKGARFPAKYQRALFCLDWTFATIYAVQVENEGHGYTGEWEEFLTAKALPLTDAIVGSDGHLYFASGGRKGASKLWRVRYLGSEDTGDAWQWSPKRPGQKEDRFSRYERRVNAELAGIEAVRSLVGKGSNHERITMVMGLARVGGESERETAMKELLSFPWEELNREEQLAWLRALGLVFSRTGEPSEEERQAVLAKIDAFYPNEDRQVEDELCRMLCYLQAPGVVSRTLALLAKPEEKREVPDWSRLIERGSRRYGEKAAEVMRELGSPRKIHFAYCLRVVKGPWTEGQRRQLMEWYAREEKGKAQESARLGLARMRDDTLANATEEERLMVEVWGLRVKRDPFENLPKAQGPARVWTVEEMTAIAEDLSQANVENGKQMFRATLCAACHRVGREGGAAGPDLTNVGGRFSAEELAIAILDPSRAISDQYEFKMFFKDDGSVLVGKVLDERDEILVIATNPFDFAETVSLSRSEIKETKPSPVSPMPGALVNQLNETEMRDFLGYLLGTD